MEKLSAWGLFQGTGWTLEPNTGVVEVPADIGHEPVGNAARDYNVIFRAITQSSERAFQGSPTFEDEDNLVRPAVSIILEFAVALLRFLPVRDHVLIEKHRDAAGVEIAFPRNVRGL